MDQGHLWVVPMRKGDNSNDHQHPSRWESLNNQLASHTGVSLENQSSPSCHISKPVCKLHQCQLELAATLCLSLCLVICLVLPWSSPVQSGVSNSTQLGFLSHTPVCTSATQCWR